MARSSVVHSVGSGDGASFVKAQGWRAINRLGVATTMARRPRPAGDDGPVLVIQLAKIGDFILTTPLIRSLAKAYPERGVVLAVSPGTLELAAVCPYASAVVPIATRMEKRHLVSNLAAIRRAGPELAGLRPSIAVVARWSADLVFESAAAVLSGAGTRVGFSESANPYRAKRNTGFDRLFTATHLGVPGLQESRQQLLLLELLGVPAAGDAPEVWWTEQDEATVGPLMAPAELGSGPIALAPGASTGHRRWPLERFGAVARQLAAMGWAPVVIGGPEDVDLGRIVSAHAPGAIDLCGRLTLRQTAAALSRCQLAIVNDSGPAHLAAAAGTPLVELSPHPDTAPVDHDNAPERYGPVGVPSVILRPTGHAGCRPAGCTAVDEAHCIREIGADAVLEAALRMLEPDTRPLGRR